MRRRGFIFDCEGAAAAEMALILPIAVLLLFAGFESANYFYSQHQISKGLRDGARFAARQNFNDINCRSGASISSGVVAQIQNVARTGKASGGNARISGWDNADITVTVTCPTAAEAQTGIFTSSEPAPQVNLTTTINYDSLFNGLGVITDSAVIGARHQATVMGI
ncbi:pilus assembly protein [Altererythrobacter arenosus]|uniref:Pilus assembly protein n=2 Tax=Altererythrobacter arenosus TaxID=3032592 RepID=A0ABY8FPB1_9SPHN|nr:TadE/TadG family type IV pilus assembly protein [Altererythrobacter sp. CAU 1644]WFL76627.1 pilus assembly protein [Altererythrobacter sp. CAU 1644]